MIYEHEGQIIDCKDDEVIAIAKSLDLNPDILSDLKEAMYVWACDNDKIVDQEQQAANDKAKGVTFRVESGKKRSPKRKPNEDKMRVISSIAKFLVNSGYDNVEIPNPQGTITFTTGEKRLSLKLTQHR